jgi:hypothetical protein
MEGAALVAAGAAPDVFLGVVVQCESAGGKRVSTGRPYEMMVVRPPVSVAHAAVPQSRVGHPPDA